MGKMALAGITNKQITVIPFFLLKNRLFVINENMNLIKLQYYFVLG